MKTELSESIFARAQALMPGGVNSPVRSFNHFGRSPPVIKKAERTILTDVDGNTYADFCMSWGALMLGHAHPKVIEAVSYQIKRGTSFGMLTEQEVDYAEMVVKLHPALEMMRMVSSGTEATMSAIRVARGYTKRDKIIKFNGHYHGHSDCLLVKAGSGVIASCSMASSSGVPDQVAATTLSLPFGDLELLEKTLRNGDIAAVILEPVNANIGVVVPTEEHLKFIRRITEETGTLLIIDEVVTGFRLGAGGAAKMFDVEPDLTCLGKIVGGGFPAAIYGGKKEYMSLIAPKGGVYQAGTLSGNPVAIAAGMATLKELSRDGFYNELERKMEPFAKVEAYIKEHELSASLQRIGSMWTLFFGKSEVRAFEDLKDLRYDLFKDYFFFLLERGIYISPAQYEASFISAVHTDEEIERCAELTIEFLKRADVTTALKASTREDLVLTR